MCVWCSFSVFVLVGDLFCCGIKLPGGEITSTRRKEASLYAVPHLFPHPDEGRTGTKIQKKKESKRCGNRILRTHVSQSTT